MITGFCNFVAKISIGALCKGAGEIIKTGGKAYLYIKIAKVAGEVIDHGSEEAKELISNVSDNLCKIGEGLSNQIVKGGEDSRLGLGRVGIATARLALSILLGAGTYYCIWPYYKEDYSALPASLIVVASAVSLLSAHKASQELSISFDPFAVGNNDPTTDPIVRDAIINGCSTWSDRSWTAIKSGAVTLSPVVPGSILIGATTLYRKIDCSASIQDDVCETAAATTKLGFLFLILGMAYFSWNCMKYNNHVLSNSTDNSESAQSKNSETSLTTAEVSRMLRKFIKQDQQIDETHQQIDESNRQLDEAMKKEGKTFQSAKEATDRLMILHHRR